ncbi:MAG: FAD-binding oxidoreductase [Nitrososphaerota archaeon]|nr:FAD-binding oxidoreductase [Nitrososphaerota archaeon]
MAERYDVVIVGAGIMGVASAYHLQRNNPGKRIVIVDRFGAAGQGNTGRSNSMFRNTFSSSDNQILSNSSIDFYLHLQEELGVDIGLQKIGYLWLMDGEQLDRSRPFLEKMEDNGIETARYDRESILRMLPGMGTALRADAGARMMGLPDVDGAVFGLKCGRLDPDRLLRFYSSEFVKAGGRFAFNSEVKSLLLGPSKRLGIEGEPLVWQDARIEGVSLAGAGQEALFADTVVIAGGAWLNELLEPIGIDGHVKAKKRQLFSVHAEGSDMRRLLRVKGFNSLGLAPMVILPRAGVHFKPVGEEDCFWVGCEDEINRPFIDLPGHDLEGYRAEPEYYQRGVLPVLSAYFPCFQSAGMKAMWAGLYAYNTLDNLPFVFRNQNLIVVGGDSGSGIMKGDSLGRVVDAVYRGEEEAGLYGDVGYDVSKLGFEKRDVEPETWTL